MRMMDEQHSFEESTKLLQEFFPDDTFQDDRYEGMSLKRIMRNKNPHADRLLDWIEKGCCDALQKKYLETVTLGIFTDPGRVEVVLESYTLTISYPSSRDHEMIRSLRNVSASMTLQIDTGATKQVITGKGTFAQQMTKILRTLCIMLQTLKPLPEKKHAGMHITYYDELTPSDYEPPGFVGTVFDVKYLFEKPTLKHDFGIAESNHHKIGVGLETAALNCEEESAPPDVADSAPTLLISQALPGRENTQASPGRENTRALPGREHTQETIVPVIQKVACLCGDSESDLDMIQCDTCQVWQHTPCAGYCTNKDKRIPEKYVCFTCQHQNNKKLLKNIQDLASFRRAISVVFSEGLESIAWLSKRLGCGVAKASKLIRRLEGEGLISKPNSQIRTWSYTVHKTPEAKEKIRYFFGSDLSAFPELVAFFKGKRPAKSTEQLEQVKQVEQVVGSAKALRPLRPAIPSKRRKSISTEKVSCN